MTPSVRTGHRHRRARLSVTALLATVGVACLGTFAVRAVGDDVPRARPAAIVTAAAPAVPGGGDPSGGTLSSYTLSSQPLGRESPGREPPGRQQAAERTASSRGPARVPDANRAEAVSAPVHLSIPAIGVSQRLLRLGLQRDRTVEVPAPADSQYPGWYRLGTSPGQVGSAVILGHVDSMTGPAVFYRLRYLTRGNRVDVTLESGAVAHFTVRDVVTYPNSRFPARTVYASHGYRGLNLVTCGGAYEKSRGGYQSNLVVYTRLTGTTPPA